MRGSLALVIAGLAISAPASLVAARKVAPVLFGIRAADSLTFMSTAGLLLAVGRAASMDPMAVLLQD